MTWTPPEVGPISLLAWPAIAVSPWVIYGNEIRQCRTETALERLVDRWAEWWTLPFCEQPPQGLPDRGSSTPLHCVKVLMRGNNCRHVRRGVECRGSVIATPAMLGVLAVLAAKWSISESFALYLVLRPEQLRTYGRQVEEQDAALAAALAGAAESATQPEGADA